MALGLLDAIKPRAWGGRGPASINRHEIAVHAVAALAIVASTSFWSLTSAGFPSRIERPVMADFGQYLAGGKLIATGKTRDLYDPKAFQRSYMSVVPWAQEMIYPPAYPPHLYACFVPLASLSYIHAALAFTFVSLTAYVIAVWLLASDDASRRFVVLVALASPALQHTVMAGQLGAFGLLMLAWFWRAWRARRDVIAGLALGALFWKPHLLAFAACAWLVRPSAGLALGVAIAVGAQIALVVAVFGHMVWRDYIGILNTLVRHPEIFSNRHQSISLRGGLGLLIDQPELLAVSVLCGTLLILWAVRRVGRAGRCEESLLAITMGGLLVSPHAYSYDAVMLSGGLSALLSSVLQRGWRSSNDLVAYLVYWSPFVVGFARLLPIQLTCWLSFAWLIGASCSPRRRTAVGDGPGGESLPRS